MVTPAAVPPARRHLTAKAYVAIYEQVGVPVHTPLYGPHARPMPRAPCTKARRISSRVAPP
eukprot:85767-Chlamydomonas_euryale.AAC.3